LLAIGAADYGFEWWDNEKQLRMTRQELKRDLRDTDGDPQIRARREKMRRAMLAQGISAEMPMADVVVTNPTHFAVALRYDAAEMSAPKVVALGQRAVAREIIRLARMHGVEIVENPPVARSLFRSCELGGAVPEALYAVVAEIFAAVYRRRQARQARTWRGG
jgi:flagellar biosynthesis protein FlhB